MRKTVLITGAGIGIGKATAIAFARAGYDVAVTDVLVLHHVHHRESPKKLADIL